MSWVTITASDIETRLSDPELSGSISYDLAAGQGDPTAEVISLTVAEVRGYIPQDCLDTNSDTVPPELKDTAILVAIEKLAGRLSNAGCIMTEERQRAYEFAMQRLRDTARGNYHITGGEAYSKVGLDPDSDDISGGNSTFSYGGEERLDF
jgi:hypothetical protein